MPQSREQAHDAQYLEIILRRLRVSADYLPKLGQGRAISLSAFQAMYQADAFYSWFGLDHPMIYAAHKAAGGITSIYRQIGIGCEALFRQVLIDHLSLSEEAVKWSYAISTAQGDRRLALDARIPMAQIQDERKKQAVVKWVLEAADSLDIDTQVKHALKGAVFEIRQGYKSKDSKRQNADIANAAAAYKTAYLPVVVLLSTQIDEDIAARYSAAGLLLLYGKTTGTTLNSTYRFSQNVIGYDLAAFFERNTETLRAQVAEIVQTLLAP